MSATGFGMPPSPFPMMGMQQMPPMGQPQPQSNTLYVGDIPKEASQQEIWQHFLQWGNVMGVQLVNRSNNNESANFAFVTFGSSAEASNARERSDHSVLLGKEIRVQFKTNAAEFSADANLFFNNLSKNMSAKALESECENFGRVMSCKLKYDSDGIPIGYGYVQFEDKEDAARCIEGLNGKILNDKAISVSKFVQRSKRAANLNPNKNLFIRNFPIDWDEPRINMFIGETFQKFGETQSVGICKDKIRERYYAFVAYYNEDEARAAYDELNDEQIPGYEEKLYVNFAKSKRQFKMEQLQKFIQQPTNLYIKWLRADATQEEIQNAFELFGTVTSVCLKENITSTMTANLPQNYALNFAFVNYANPDDAKTALTMGKNDDIIKDLLDPEWHKTKQEFLYYAQNKTHRLSYLKAKRKKKNQISSFGHMATLMEQLQNNPSIQKQLMKILQSQGVQLPGGTKGPMGNFPGGFGDFGGNGGSPGFGNGNTPMPNQPFSTRPPKPYGNDFNKDSYSKYGPKDGSKYGDNKYGDNKSERGGRGGRGGYGGGDRGGFNNNMNSMMNNMNSGNMMNNMNKMGMNSMSNMMSNMNNFNNMNTAMGGQGGIPGMPHNMQNMMGMGNNLNMNQGGRSGMNSANNYFGSGQKSGMDNFQSKNPQQQQPQMGGMYPGQQGSPAVRDYEWLKNNEEEFMSLSPSDQKTILGNTLYPKISQLLNNDESMVPKVTGMLVDMDTLSVADIRYMIDSADELRARVQEAIEIFQDENRNEMSMGGMGDYN
jgi:RNA recognition motif-containing protein